ncbi:hypothetical protein [Haladaptatus caseinilyticus]|uniref:hypothetical protein n=1 Tax=Haladaptatus caseinilyticus TaxID=2993314 RepID=UPI00224B9CCB|nr:hypothetical protein [Haladaptatus caseinilyticus]
MKVQVGEEDVNELQWRIDAKVGKFEFEWGPFEIEIEIGGDVTIELELVSDD